MLYLLAAIASSALLAWLVTWWHRRPKSLERGIDEFWEARQAIAPRPPESPPPDGPSPPSGDGPPSGGGGRR